MRPAHLVLKSKLLFAPLVLAASALLLAFIASPTFATDQAGKRQKVIDFDDEVVEGLNKRPLDSMNEISERDRKRRKPHLYRKRGGFRTETAESLQAVRYTQ